MTEIFKVHLATRERVVDLLNKHSDAELNHIVEGFSNNLIWNAAHILVTQHLLTYARCNKDIPLNTAIVEAYRKGSKPESTCTSTDIALIKDLLIASHETFKRDFEQGYFTGFQHYITSYGVPLDTIEDAVVFNNTHEGLHLGYMMAMRKKL